MPLEIFVKVSEYNLVFPNFSLERFPLESKSNCSLFTQISLLLLLQHLKGIKLSSQCCSRHEWLNFPGFYCKSEALLLCQLLLLHSVTATPIITANRFWVHIPTGEQISGVKMAGTAGLTLGAAFIPVKPRKFFFLAWFVPQTLDQPPTPLPQSQVLLGISLTFRGCHRWKETLGGAELMCWAWDSRLGGNALLWEQLPGSAWPPARGWGEFSTEMPWRYRSEGDIYPKELVLTLQTCVGW